MTPEEAETLPYRPCVGVMLANREGKVFAGVRCDTPGAWQMPQGGIDKGEDARTAALRELWEETGVVSDLVVIEAETSEPLTYDLPPELLGKVWKGRYRGQVQTWILARFTGSDEDIDIATEHPEFAEWAWLDAASLVDRIVPFKRAIYEKVVAEFSPKL